MSEISPTGDPWSRFSRDPRDPAVSALRTGDVDRAVLTDVLGEAFSDGRLTREEYDERADEAVRARTYGDFLPLMQDLVPTSGAAAPPVRRGDTPDLQRAAVKAYERKRRDSWVEAVTITLICTGIWLAISLAGGGFDPHFPWPIIVAVIAFADSIETTASREKYIEKERAKLERKARKQERKELPGS
ncbi:DUF1707 domain-containing protein [Mumia sp. zg.B53]|uniref:DUF1707 SHOCT-like domain-containing protein n=1 Tax=Mumia sp. zg.B53 TaxID=2855449 RepID=UPI001C6DFFA2|nr:DUF1707 domain-containing protein [Mumia sp. zg.B53]MBW9214821.1 DUF1707 domain-containing protein [Mumia sp. zg.B53]